MQYYILDERHQPQPVTLPRYVQWLEAVALPLDRQGLTWRMRVGFPADLIVSLVYHGRDLAECDHCGPPYLFRLTIWQPSLADASLDIQQHTRAIDAYAEVMAAVERMQVCIRGYLTT